MLNFGSALKPPRNVTTVLALLGTNSDRDQNKRRDNGVEVWFPTLKCGNETRAPCKQRNRLHFFIWRRLAPCWECKENREQKGKQNSWAAQEWGCASVG